MLNFIWALTDSCFFAKKPQQKVEQAKAEQEAEQAKLILMGTAAKQKLASKRMASPKLGRRQDPEFDSKLSKYFQNSEWHHPNCPEILKTPSTTEHKPLVISSSNKSK
jgi:hypothetical protein